MDRQSDGGVLYNSNFGRALREGKLDIRSPSSLPHSTDVAPYVVVGDEAFPLQNNSKTESFQLPPFQSQKNY